MNLQTKYDLDRAEDQTPPRRYGNWYCRHVFDLLTQMQAEVVTGSVLEILTNTQVSLCSLNRRMAEGELDLLEGGAAAVGQFGEGAAEIVRARLGTPMRFPYLRTASMMFFVSILAG